MTMVQQTIQAVGAVNEWTGSHGKMFEITLTLDDGRTGRVNAKTPDRWSVGDAIVVTSERQTKHGLKWSIDKADYHNNNSGGSSSSSAFKKNDDRTPQIEASWAIGQAVAAGRTQDRESIMKAAQAFLDLRDELVEMLKASKSAESGQESTQAVSQGNDQGLPF